MSRRMRVAVLAAFAALGAIAIGAVTRSRSRSPSAGRS